MAKGSGTIGSRVTRRQFVGLLAASGAVAASGLLSACTGQTTGGQQASGTKKKGGTLTVGMTADVITFDPHSVGNVHGNTTPSFYDSLTRYDAKMKPLPRLAEKWEQAADGTSITLTLRQGVKFHSGREFTADDVLKNFDKARNKDTGLNMYPQTATVADVQAKDKRTVTVKFSKPAPDVFDTLGILYLIDPEAQAGLKNKAAGTGPFKFVEWTPGDHITAERNPSYWEKDRPYLDKVTFKVYGDVDAMTAALESGLIDVAAGVPDRNIGRLKDKFQIVEGPKGAGTMEFRINATKPPFDKKEVRQAIHYATNRKGIVDKVLFGLAATAVLPFPDYSPAWDPKWDNSIKYDLDKAKDLIAKGGYPNGFEATLLTATSVNPIWVDVAQVLQDDLAKIGCKLKIEVVDTAPYYERLSGAKMGDFQIVVSGSGKMNNYPTGITLNSIYRLANNPGWGNNVPKAYVDAVNDANGTIDTAKQKEAFKRMTEAIMDESWVIPIAWLQQKFAVAKHVKDLSLDLNVFTLYAEAALDK